MKCERCDEGTYELYPVLLDEVEWGGQTWTKDGPWKNVWATFHELGIDYAPETLNEQVDEETGELLAITLKVPGLMYCSHCNYTRMSE